MHSPFRTEHSKTLGRASPDPETPVLSYEGSRFIFRCPYEQNDLARDAHMFWDKHRKAWSTLSYRYAARLIRYANQDAKRRLIDKFYRGHPRDSSMDQPGRGGRNGYRVRR